VAVLSGSITIVEVFDQGANLVSRNPMAVGVLWLTALPVRCLTVLLVVTVMTLGDQSRHAAGTLETLAWQTTVAWLVSLWGRQCYVRACAQSMAGTRPTLRALLRVPGPALLAHLQVALLIEVLFWALLPLMVVAPCCVVLAAVGAVTAPLVGPGWWRPVRSLALPAGIIALLLVSLSALVGIVIACVNLHLVVLACRWLGGALVGVSVATWSPLVSWDNPLYRGLLLVGGGLAIEPLYLAIVVAIVDRAYARSSGQDLRHWFSEIEASNRAAAEASSPPVVAAATQAS
jgi:hypothetical protein